ncbi:MAG: hypothetical protein A4E53_01647 [Pelotomaculum sp. PtaB.Bin104]|nr:MAG: hypothetical protein A4E53_01647 [Pelotomaculum sp. PtaB.Bin104]
MTIDFKALNSALLPNADLLLSEFLPGGKVIGQEYTCASLQGGVGQSCRINVRTGLWSDFATGESGGDIISLYAKIKGVSQVDSAQYLASRVNFPVPAVVENEPKIILPPPGTPAPNIKLKKYSCFPSAIWSYHDKEGRVWFYTTRYDPPDGHGKEFCPWVYTDKGRWKAGLPATPRPLYDLHLLLHDKQKPVLIVEGEKSAEAAKRLLMGRIYTVTTWAGGTNSWNKADWTPLYRRKVLIWPDADVPGLKAATEIGKELLSRCPEVKIIDVAGQPEGWDAADMVAEGYTYEEFKEWAQSKVKVMTNEIASVSMLAVQATSVKVDTHQESDIYHQSLYSLWEKAGVETTSNGAPVCNLDNCLRVLEYWPEFKGKIWYDEFYGRYFTTIPGNRPPHPIQEIDRLKMSVWLQRHLGLKRICDDVVRKAMLLYADQDIRQEPRDWIASLEWDKTPRIWKFFHSYVGAEDNDYTRAVSVNFWVSLMARVFDPGCKVDNMVILEGAQGKKKSTLFEEIGGKWHSENNERISHKDFLQVLRGKIIVEFADLSTWSNADVKQLKQLLTCRIDTYRKSYGEDAQDWPRQSIFVGTTNEYTYLRDETGARRFWPIKIGKSIHINKLREDREQLFAEAKVLFDKATSWWEVPASAEREQENRRQFDEWEQIISRWLIGRQDATVEEIAHGALAVTKDRLDRGTIIRIRQAMIANRWQAGEIIRDGVLARGWVPQNGHIQPSQDDDW